MGSAIEQGIIKIPADPSDVKASCLTSNCTFGSYSTMGICSRVDDVTPDVVEYCSPGSEFSGESPACSYTVRELQVHPPWRLSDLTAGRRGAGGENIPPETLWVGASDSYSFLNPNTLTEFYVIYVPDTTIFNTAVSSPDSAAKFPGSVVALKGGLDLCINQYNTTFINGTTKTVELNKLTDLKWSTIQKTVKNNNFTAVSCQTGGSEYWMDEKTLGVFNHFLGLEVFQGSSSYGLNLNIAGIGGESDASRTFARLLVNQSRAVGQDGLKEMLENMAIGMTNA